MIKYLKDAHLTSCITMDNKGKHIANHASYLTCSCVCLPRVSKCNDIQLVQDVRKFVNGRSNVRRSSYVMKDFTYTLTVFNLFQQGQTVDNEFIQLVEQLEKERKKPLKVKHCVVLGMDDIQVQV